MPGFDGTGPRGMGPMTGGGRGFCGSFGTKATRNLYVTRRWGPYSYPDYRAYGFRNFAPRITREQELEVLKEQADALRDELKELESEIGKISGEKE